MDTMNAAVVTSFDEPPHYLSAPAPTPVDGELLVEVLAAGLHPRVRSGASGAHYTSTGALPLIPGIDGVGRRDDGGLVYFVADDDAGTMAERAVVDPRRAVELPSDADVPRIAAAMNPAMSSWVALRRRVPVQAGQTVFVLGATGNAGGMAVQIARLLGAGRVIGAGRDRSQLDALDADAVVQLTGDADATARALAVAAEADIVLDYLWGEPAAHAMMALLTQRDDRSRLLEWVQIGAVAGPTMALPSAALRSANLRIQGNGQGAVSPQAYVAELPALVDEIDAGRIRVEVETAPLADVEAVWTRPTAPGVRTVLIP